MKGLAASLLGGDPGNLERDMLLALEAGVDLLHIDAMDGHFAPNIAFGPDTVARLRQKCQATFDVHLMLSEFDRYLQRYAEAGADWITVHLEAGLHHDRHLRTIRSLGCKAGLALNPGTPVDAAADLLGAVDLLLIMSVNPGFAGGAFIARSVEKVSRAASLREASRASFAISVDGGVNEHNIPELKAAGADILVTASSLFGGGSVRERASALKRALAGAGA